MSTFVSLERLFEDAQSSMSHKACCPLRCTALSRTPGRPIVSAEVTSVQRSSRFVLQSPHAGWTARDKGDDDDDDGDDGEDVMMVMLKSGISK